MNTLDIHKLDDDRVRVTIKSEGERDQHVDMTVDELLRVVAAGTSNPQSGAGASQETPPPLEQD